LRNVVRNSQDPAIEPKNRLMTDVEELVYAPLLSHSSIDIRIRTYQLLVTSVKTITPIRSSVLRLLKNHFVYLQGQNDPGKRGEINAITKALIHRLRRSNAFHFRAMTALKDVSNDHRFHWHEIQQYETFFDGFISFLVSELSPSCSFPRHISALRAMEILVISVADQRSPLETIDESSQDGLSWRLGKRLRHQNVVSSLFHLLLNPFEEVRTVSSQILKLHLRRTEAAIETPSEAGFKSSGQARGAQNNYFTPPSYGKIQAWTEEDIARLVVDVNNLATRTNRADHADGLARLLELQYYLAEDRPSFTHLIIEQFKKLADGLASPLSHPSKDISLHGHLLGLMYIIKMFEPEETYKANPVLNDTKILFSRIFDLCLGVWHAVSPDLCVDSPEFSRKAEPAHSFEGPKDFLAYSWRALRDSSLLMQAMLSRLGSDGSAVLLGSENDKNVWKMFGLSLEQLTKLRHRGAFSTVAETFALCCERLAGEPKPQAAFQEWQLVSDQHAMPGPGSIRHEWTLTRFRLRSRFSKTNPKS
jgi:Putative death-receptor fusion protein (DUF2428)